ncbi:proline dehydrogenase family protein [Bacillus sp. REN10]|uniref:proline dehydrogenase family protein n=1 Tax=Bacillus sp. REN10 TaxID=2782541 RepID=UPI00193B948C|nr:proline dehydrogenase family protein [Bacillus sp. REN10]
MNNHEIQVAQALKSIARNQQIKSFVQQSNELYPLLLKAAKRFVAGEKKQEGIEVANDLISKGYCISLEYMGENITNLEECIKAKDEFLSLIEEMSSMSRNQTVSLDLSHIGLSVSPDIAYSHLLEIAKKAKQFGITVMISMEESLKTDAILDIYKKVTRQYSNVGITLQAHLYRSSDDFKELIDYPGKIRIVKGAYQESNEIAMSRSKELNDRYLEFVDQLIKANHPVSIATNDEILIQEIQKRQYLNHPNTEIEMLYGVRPDLLKDLKAKGYNCRAYLTYGQEWYLYLCHRIAEYPENLSHAVLDMIRPSLLERNRLY